MRRCRGPPNISRVHTRDQYLSVCEFEQSLQIGLGVRERQTLRNENDRAVRTLQRAGQGIIIANGIPPHVHDTRLFESAPADGRAAAPAEISAFLAEHGDQRRIPRGEQRSRRISATGKEPAHGGCRADSHIPQWRYEMMQPASRWTSI